MKKIFISAVLLVMGTGAFAQNLNPTVEVTNVYAREATGIEKPSQLLEMPDTVLRFNLDMDYTVNNTPYRGSYEFRPYLVQLRPQPRPSDEGTLFVRAGAGYSLHPEATVVWTPVKKNNFRLNLFGDHSSYFGDYRNIRLQDRVYQADGTYSRGREMHTAVGADGLYTWAGGSFAADVQYRNILGTSFTQGDLSNNILQLRAGVKSAPGTAWDYEANTRLANITRADFREFHTMTEGSLGTHFGAHRIGMGLFAETVSQTGGFVGKAGLVPHYFLNTGNFHMKLGVRLSFLFRSDAAFCPHPSGIVFPDVQISFDAVRDALVLYASATGGDNIISYDRMLSQNAFMGGFLWHTDNMVTRLNAAVGLRGNIASRFHYDVAGGYSWNENAWTWGVVGDAPSMGYASPLHTFYVKANLGWKSERIDVDANVYYGYTPLPDLKGQTLFAPAPFKAQAHAFYIWGGRIKGGVTADIRSKLPGPRVIPGFVDLGLLASLQMTRTLGFWLKGGNLLNQTIQRVPFYAEKGVYFTLGATLSL